MTSEARTKRTLWVLLASSLLLKLGLLGVAERIPAFADERQYVAAALTIAENGVPSYANPQWDEAHYPPAYPYFMGAVCKLFGGSFQTAVRIVQALFGTASAWLLFLAARRLFGDRTALVSAGVWAFFPTAICYTQLFLGETLFALLVLGVPVLLTPAESPLGARQSFLAGLLAGFATLTRSIFLPQSFLVAAWILLCGTKEGSWRRRLPLSALFVAGLFCVVLPWSARNTLRYDRFLLIDTGAGNVLHLNWNMVDPWNNDIGLLGRHQADREAAKEKGIPRRRRFKPEDPNDIVARNQGEIRLALQWLGQNPGLFMRHSLMRAAEFVNPTSMLVFRLRNGDYGRPPAALTEALVLVVVVGTMLLLVAGFAGMALFGLQREHALYAILFLSAFASGALLMSITRYRFPSMPLLVPFAVHVLLSPRELPSFGEARGRWIIASGTTLLLAIVFVLYAPYNYPG